MKTVRVTTLALCLLFATGSFAFHLAFSPQKAAAEKRQQKSKNALSVKISYW